jgi:periplasmic protein CpxP/Spy
MFRTIVTMTAVAVALGGAPLVAQGGPPGQPPAGGMGGGQGMGARRMEMLLKGITLSADQQKKVDSIQTAVRESMPPMTPGQPPSPEDRQKRMDAMRKSDDDIRTVLTPEQQTIFDKNAEEMRSRMRPPA